MGGGGRTRHFARPAARRRYRQRREELVHGGISRILAVFPRLAIHSGNAVPAAGCDGINFESEAQRMSESTENKPSAGSASDGHTTTPGELDASHGVVLYLDD